MIVAQPATAQSLTRRVTRRLCRAYRGHQTKESDKMASYLEWDAMEVDEKVDQLRKELDEVLQANKKLEKAIEEQNSVISKMGFQIAKLS